MKEFTEKLIGRLEELKKTEQNRPDDCDEEGYGDGEQIYDDGRSQGRFEQTHKIIEIVNELAEEHESDYCEWNRQDESNFYLHKTSCGTEDTYDDSYVFCPYCGKKIKVVE